MKNAHQLIVHRTVGKHILRDVGFIICDVRRTTEVVTVIEESFLFRSVISLCNHIYTVRTVFVTSNLRPK